MSILAPSDWDAMQDALRVAMIATVPAALRPRERARLTGCALPRDKRERPMAALDVERAADLYRSGKTLEQTAGVLGVSRKRISRAFARIGVQSRPSNKATPAIVSATLRLHERGMKNKHISDELGIGQNIVARILKEARA
jgi:AraC-like DNA-binding protein